jgi:signal transduction histidine kinase
VLIEHVLVEEKEIATGRPARLQPDEQRVEFQFTALTFRSPEKARFRYILEGFDRSWIDAGGRRSALYSRLPAGKYTFRVQASNGDAVWNEAGAFLSFERLAPFYETPGFLAALTVALIALAALAYRRKVQLMHRQYDVVLAERARLARELHDTLLQSLAGASLQLNAISKAIATAPDEARKALDSIRQQMNASFREARQKIWDLRSPALEGRDLPGALKESLEKMTGAMEGFRLTVTGEPRALPPHMEEQLLRIGEECVTNALRHAEAGNIMVELRV